MKAYEPVLTQEVLQQRVKELAEEIGRNSRGRDLVLIAMLKGSLYFLADLSRRLAIPHSFDFIAISRSPDGHVRPLLEPRLPLAGRDILVVEDIIRSGLTTNLMIEKLEQQKPARIEICALLVQKDQQLVTLPLKYIGFSIGYERLVGYGLDYREHDRHLPFIAKLDKSRYETAT